MGKQRITEAEVLSAIRSQGIGSLEHVEAVVIETDGSISVISGGVGQRPSALQQVCGFRSAQS